MTLTRTAFLVATLFAAGMASAQAPVVRHRPASPPIAIDVPPPVLRVSDAQAQPIRLSTMKVDTRVVGRLAQTTVELGFRNPNARVLEGELQFPLLDGQQVSALALDINGQWRAAVPVEKAKGRQVFEDVRRVRVDPALLESTEGNNFRLRVYPIPANGERRVRITYVEHLSAVADGKTQLRIPLAGGTKLDRFDFKLALPGVAPRQVSVLRGLADAAPQAAGEGSAISLTRENYQPQKAIELALDVPAKPVSVIEEFAGAQYFYTELATPAFDAKPVLRPNPAQLALVWDASGSGAARDHGREFALLDAYFKAIGDTQVSLTLARDRAERAGSFSVKGGDWSALRAALERVAYDGATNPEAFKPAARAEAVLLVTDGLINFGAQAMPAFDAPLLAVSASASADLPRLRHAAQVSGGAAVDLTRTAAADAVRMLRAQPARVTALRANGARDLVASEPDAAGRIAVAGVLDSDTTLEIEWRTPQGAREVQRVPLARAGAVQGVAAQQWARMRIEELEPEFAVNKREIERLGKRYSLVTRATSLIVLDNVADYVRHDIEPPAELRAEFDRLKQTARAQQQADQAAHLDDIVRRFQERKDWWNKSFPKGAPPQIAQEKKRDRAVGGVADMENAVAPAPAPAVAAAPMRESASPAEARMQGAARDAAKSMAAPASPALAKPAVREPGDAPASIQLKKWQPDAPYAKRLRDAAPRDLYRVYLDERPGYTDSTAFYLDAADIFAERGEPQLAARILSNLAEMDLGNRHVLRILGYRLLQLKDAPAAVRVLERVLELAPDEPQSWRDLALAQAQAGNRQQAIENLYQVVTKPWHGRFPDIELIALGELNAIAATAPQKLDTRAIDPRLLTNLPVDLRAVLSWDADDTDIDLWVTDPNGEKVYYAHNQSYQGGRISRDFTGGYGPEEFLLKQAKPGKYLVQAQFYGHRQQVVSGATTLQLTLTTGFGTAKQRDQSVTLRLKSGGETVTVGEFVIGEAK